MDKNVYPGVRHRGDCSLEHGGTSLRLVIRLIKISGVVWALVYAQVA